MLLLSTGFLSESQPLSLQFAESGGYGSNSLLPFLSSVIDTDLLKNIVPGKKQQFAVLVELPWERFPECIKLEFISIS